MHKINKFESFCKENQNVFLAQIGTFDQVLQKHFKNKFLFDSYLNRSLVSFQANKTRAIYRWYKFKEAFSASLVEYLFNKYKITKGKILDPFTGSGTALFVASSLGINADGIEILPIGVQIIKTKQLLDEDISDQDTKILSKWAKQKPWIQTKKKLSINELRITKDAYPAETKLAIERYLAESQKENIRVQKILGFALFCILESISFTRKDGQYLRWDQRSGRRQGNKSFNKGEILDFDIAITNKLNEIISDISSTSTQQELFPAKYKLGNINLYDGSCLNILPTLNSTKYDAIITSPPYCNRYDYTRTYALELALLGIDEIGLTSLRQNMLSATVENRAKDLLKISSRWKTVINIVDKQKLLQTILNYLEFQREAGLLNNNGIPRMVKGYFYELACAIYECARVLKPNAPLFMVNDNVRYAGASISVDMILSNIAEKLGFRVENILVLPNGKGNSSQQMGEHGKEILRKCVYVWRKKL